MEECNPNSSVSKLAATYDAYRTLIVLFMCAGNGSRYKVLTRAVEAGGAYYTVEILGRGSAPGFVLEFAASLPAHV